MEAAPSDTVMFNPLLPGYMEDPYSHHTMVRTEAPVQNVFERWGLFRYDDCFALLRDPAMSVEDRNSDILEGERQAQAERVAGELGVTPERDLSMLNIDPPDHTRLRRLVSKAFTPRTIEELRPVIQRLVDEQLDTIAADGGGDVVDALAFPLPFDVISEMLGMPDADKDAIKEWSGHMVKAIDPIISEEEMRLAFESGIAMGGSTAAVPWAPRLKSAGQGRPGSSTWKTCGPSSGPESPRRTISFSRSSAP